MTESEKKLMYDEIMSSVAAVVEEQFKMLTENLNESQELPYCLYIDCDPVEEFDNIDDAKEAFDAAVAENPESVIDVLTADGETSVFGYGS